MPIDTDLVLLERDRGVATLTLNRPQYKNAVNLQMLQEIDGALDHLMADRPRAVILAASDPGFCSGVDLKESRESTPEFARERVSTMHRVLNKLRQFPAPVIAAADGVCLGLGCELFISADLRLATPESSFGYPEPRVAVPSPAHRLVWLIGLAHAQEMLLTARFIDADEAHRFGLVTRVSGDIGEATQATVEQVSKLSPFSLAKTKENIVLSMESGADAAAGHHIEGVTGAASTRDRQEALQAFAEKREPRFTGT